MCRFICSDAAQVGRSGLTARSRQVSLASDRSWRSLSRTRRLAGSRHWRQVSRKLAEFLVSKYCSLRASNAALPEERRDRAPGLSCFAHWYSRYFQLGRLLCLPKRNFAVFSLFSLSLFLSGTLVPFQRARGYFLYINCIRHAIADPSFVAARKVSGRCNYTFLFCIFGVSVSVKSNEVRSRAKRIVSVN